jgi:hypothetical protein
MAKQYLDFDASTGIAHWIDVDDETGIASYGTDQNVQTIIEANKADYNADHGRYGEWTKVASIPMSIYQAWEREGILGDSEEIKRRLNDPELRFFRTRPGTL